MDRDGARAQASMNAHINSKTVQAEEFYSDLFMTFLSGHLSGHLSLDMVNMLYYDWDADCIEVKDAPPGYIFFAVNDAVTRAFGISTDGVTEVWQFGKTREFEKLHDSVKRAIMRLLRTCDICKKSVPYLYETDDDKLVCASCMRFCEDHQKDLPYKCDLCKEHCRERYVWRDIFWFDEEYQVCNQCLIAKDNYNYDEYFQPRDPTLLVPSKKNKTEVSVVSVGTQTDNAS